MKYIGMYQFAKSDKFMQGKNRFTPNKEIADTICTSIKEGGVFLMENKTLKKDFCNDLIKNKKIKPYEVIKHSYTSNKMKDDKKDKEPNISPTLDTRCDCLGVAVKDKETKRYKNYITWKDKKGKFNTECNRASLENDLSLTIPASSGLTKVAENDREREQLRIRKLTPLECLKLMGFTREDYNAMRKAGMSDAALYHVAGDSIVTTVLVSIFASLFNKNHKEIIENYVEKELKDE